MRPYLPPSHEKLDILFQDEHLIAVNKPAGLLSVPGRGEDKQDCMVSRLQKEFPAALVVHRLDMATSGIMLLALNIDVQRQLSRMFELRQLEKIYIAVVNGLIEEEQGVIDAPMICDWPNRPRQVIDYENGKPAKTRFRCLLRNTEASTTRVELSPETGRSHQLRVHMQSIEHPIVGDELYNSTQSKALSTRLLLHASELGFMHPISSKPVKVRCEPDF